LANLVDRIQGVNTDPYLMAKFLSSFQHYFNVGIGIHLLNMNIRKVFAGTPADILWIDNKAYLSKRTLQFIKRISPQTVIVNLLTDDPFGQFRNAWKNIAENAPFYDYFFVQRPQNMQELTAIGAKNVGLCYRSFAPDYNRPIILNEADRQKYATTVGFIGTYEDSRASFIAYLIQNGIPVTVTGDGWPNKDYWELIAPYYRGPSVYGEAYIKSINGMEIALHFLRKGNRDLQDSRTFEIPACRVFMLAEYSEVHAALFEENKEAVFFRTKEELLQKVIYYKSESARRAAIAEAGYQRCFSGGYDHYHTLQRVLKTINKEDSGNHNING
jgi:hypothetical protein